MRSAVVASECVELVVEFVYMTKIFHTVISSLRLAMKFMHLLSLKINVVTS